MNEVFNNGTLIVHDDRDFITPEEAFDVLWNGKSIQICDPPDYGAENDHEIFSAPYFVYLQDVLSLETWEALKNQKTSEDKVRTEVYEYLRGYEIAK